MARHTTARGDLPGEYLDGPGFQCPAVCGCGIGEPAPVQSLIEDSAPAACADSSRGRRARPPAVMSPTAARTCRCTDLNIYCTQRSDLPVFASTQRSGPTTHLESPAFGIARPSTHPARAR